MYRLRSMINTATHSWSLGWCPSGLAAWLALAWLPVTAAEDLPAFPAIPFGNLA
jgi:hypothetical protein